MATRKLHYYISNSDTTIRSDHMPLRRFLLKNTKNAMVNNWAVSIEDYQLKFEYIKGVKKYLGGYHEPSGFSWTLMWPYPRSQMASSLESPCREGEKTATDNDYLVEQVVEGTKVEPKKGPMGDVVLPTWGLKDEYLQEAQSKDALCQRIFAQAAKNGEKAIHPYYVEQGILMKYVSR